MRVVFVARASTFLYGAADTSTDRNADSATHADTVSRSDGDADAETADPDPRSYGSADADAGADSDPDAGTVLQHLAHHHHLPDADPSSDGYADGRTDRNPGTDSDARQNAYAYADPDSVRTDAFARSDADSDPRSVRYPGRRRPLSGPLAIALSALLYGIAAFALSLAVGGR